MKAAVWTRYGPPEVLQLQEVEKPIPKDDEVLVRIRATTVSAGDCEMRRLEVPMLLRLPTRLYVGVRRPKRITILGQELAGEVEAVGKTVTRFGEGDPVIAATGFSQGAYAQYLSVNENPTEGVLARKPDGEVRPWLVSRWREREGGRKVDLYLRPGVYFHDHFCFPNKKDRQAEYRDLVYSLEQALRNRKLDLPVVGLATFL